MSTVIGKLDNRIRLLEDNQNKIANSLSRFLDKMNSLLFKGTLNIFQAYQKTQTLRDPI